MADELPSRPDEDKLEHDPVLPDHDEDQAGPGILPSQPTTSANSNSTVTMTSGFGDFGGNAENTIA